MKIGPSAKDLAGRYEYYLDYPGTALDPGCDYERWERRLTAAGSAPTVYAHVAADPGHPGKLALQYWFFYVFNDFNTTTAVLIPVALWLAVRWSLLAQVVELEGAPAVDSLRRSARLVRGRWFRVASLVGVGLVLALAIGPLVGALLILLTHASLPLLNVIAGIVYALAMPFVAITTAYVYFDARVRTQLEPSGLPAELLAEIELSAG